MKNPQEQTLLRLPEAAARLSISRSTLYLMIGKGELSVVRIGRAVRLPVAALEEWIAKQKRMNPERNDASFIV